jgi:hypothetical protein
VCYDAGMSFMAVRPLLTVALVAVACAPRWAFPEDGRHLVSQPLEVCEEGPSADLMPVNLRQVIQDGSALYLRFAATGCPTERLQVCHDNRLLTSAPLQVELKARSR